MTSFLEGSLAKTLHSAMKDSVAYDVDLIQVTEVADGSGGYTTTEATVEGKGFEAEYSDFHRANGQIPVGDRRVYIFQQSMLNAAGVTIKPVKHDKVSYRGITSTIINVGKDPANALWDLQTRPL
jgi:hypothetical protein